MNKLVSEKGAKRYEMDGDGSLWKLWNISRQWAVGKRSHRQREAPWWLQWRLQLPFPISLFLLWKSYKSPLNGLFVFYLGSSTPWRSLLYAPGCRIHSALTYGTRRSYTLKEKRASLSFPFSCLWPVSLGNQGTLRQSEREQDSVYPVLSLITTTTNWVAETGNLSRITSQSFVGHFPLAPLPDSLLFSEPTVGSTTIVNISLSVSPSHVPPWSHLWARFISCPFLLVCTEFCFFVCSLQVLAYTELNWIYCHANLSY